MLSVASVRSASGAANYYGKDDFASADYYAGKDAGEVSIWAGAGAEAVGLTGDVGKADLERTLNGELPSGEKVGQVENRRAGIDLTFSAPKSVSLMAYVAGDKRILGKDGAHMAAVRQTMAWVEKNLTQGRKDIDGRKVPIASGNLTYGLFQHDTSRALDPQAHIHAVIANMTRMPDGKWQALHADKIWAGNTVIGSIYHAYLRSEMEKLGYKIEATGKHGTFEIAGVPKDVIDAFSQRRADILATAEGLGLKSAQGLRSVTARTRDPKLNVEDRAGLQRDWQDKAAGLGFDGKQILRDAEREVAGQSHVVSGPLDRGYQMISEAVQSARALVGHLLATPDPLVDRAVARIVVSPAAARAQFAVASAVRIHAQREAAFDTDRLGKTALDLHLKGVTIEHIENRITQLVGRGLLIPGQVRDHETTYTAVTTREGLATEERILGEMERGRGTASAIVAAADAPDRLQAASPHELNPGQLAAATMIIASEDRIVVVQGVAGAGKSTMLQAVARVAEAEGRKVLGLAFQNKMVADLKEGAGIEAQTIASFIWANERFLVEPDSAAARLRRDELKNTIIAVDETSMVSSADMLKLVRITETLGIDRLALVGDRQQLSSIDAGKAFAMLQAGGAATARMDKNIRQRTDTLRTVAALANVGKASQALRVLGDKVIETKGEDPAAHAAERWLNLSPAEREVTAVFASGRVARQTINADIQAGLRNEGVLTGSGETVSVYESVNATREELRYAHTYKQGQTLHVTGNVPEVSLRRGTFQVTRTFANGKVEIEGNGRRHRFEPGKIDPRITIERLQLSTKADITLHEGDRIRWTANDKDRGMLNSALARVLDTKDGHITVELANKDVVTLAPGDPMLARLDLAYSLNMHMAQGITTDKAITVMASYEQNLSNQRLFNVGVTRVRDDLTVVVDDSKKLMARLDRNAGNKTSALETLGRLDIDGPGARTTPTTSQPRGAAAQSRQGDSAASAIVGAREPIDLSDLPPMPAFSREDAARYASDDGLRGLSAGDDLTGVRWPLPGNEGTPLARGDALDPPLPGSGKPEADPPMPARGEPSLPLPEKNLGLEL